MIGLNTMSTQSYKSCLPNLKPFFLLASVRVCEGRRFRKEIRSERQDDDGRLGCRNTTTKRTISPQTLWSIERSGTVNLTRFAPRRAQNGGAVGFLAQLQKTGFCTHCPLFLQRAWYLLPGQPNAVFSAIREGSRLRGPRRNTGSTLL